MLITATIAGRGDATTLTATTPAGLILQLARLMSPEDIRHLVLTHLPRVQRELTALRPLRLCPEGG